MPPLKQKDLSHFLSKMLLKNPNYNLQLHVFPKHFYNLLFLDTFLRDYSNVHEVMSGNLTEQISQFLRQG